MEDIVKSESPAIEIAKLLDDHKCTNTLILDVRENCDWTDFFVITTVRSSAHLKGILNHVKEYLYKNSLEPLHKKKHPNEKGWVLLDCGTVVIHLMEKEQRDFYELERLWFKSPIVYQSSRSS
jgi:ribosome-associated protein